MRQCRKQRVRASPDWGLIARSTLTYSALMLHLGSDLAAQDGASVIQFENGRFLATSVPHHEVFKVEGPRLVTGEAADVVLLTVVQRPDSAAGWGLMPWNWGRESRPSFRQTSCWIAQSDTVTKFSLPVGPLELGRKYDFTIEFYSAADPVELDGAVRVALREMAVAFDRDRFLTKDTAQAILQRQLDSVAVTLARRRGADGLRYIDTRTLGRCVLNTDRPPNIELTGLEVDELVSSAAALSEGATQRARFAEAIQQRDQVRGAAEAALGRLIRLRTAERRAHARRAAPDTLIFTDADLEAFRAALLATGTVASSGGDLPAAAAARLSASLASRRLSVPDREALDSALGTMNRVSRAKARYRDLLHEAALPAGLTGKVREGYFALAQAQLATESWGTKAEVDAIQIGTAFGGGFAFLDPTERVEDDGVAFVSLKFYFDAVDKSLADPFASSLSRWALNLGAVTRSTVRYRGQTQDDAFAGLKPILGVSYDFQRRMGLHAGAMIFRQPSVNPLAAGDRKRLRMAPFLGLAFDFDAFNQIADAIKED